MRGTRTFPQYSLAGTVIAGAAAMAILLVTGDTSAADAERGRLLYENHCTVCHTSVVHVRDHRKAKTREDIQSWIRRWKTELGLSWGASEIDDVTEFLNDRYYQLKDES
jgi:cytochrome c5